ncbi:MAG: tRNA adenosine(34) deaminase TadA [Actinomycetes bacterium]
MPTNYEAFMAKAIAIAQEALQSNDVPIGALVINTQGEIVGVGRNRRLQDNDPTAHAEIVALREAARADRNWRLDDHVLIVTLEPCAMCAGAISQARIKTLVFGAWDKKAGAVGSVWDVLRDPRALYKVEVIAGLMESECAALLTDFFSEFRN